jgi:hypothetical protein
LAAGHIDITWLAGPEVGPFGVPGYIFIIVPAAFVLLLALRRLFTRSARTLTEPVGTALARWTGGVKTTFVTASRGTARLELFDWGIRVSGLGLGWLAFPVWEVQYGELRTARSVRWPIANQGILLRPDGSAATDRSRRPPRPLVFSTRHSDEILAQLAGRGVSVSTDVARLTSSDLRR